MYLQTVIFSALLDCYAQTFVVEGPWLRWSLSRLENDLYEGFSLNSQILKTGFPLLYPLCRLIQFSLKLTLFSLLCCRVFEIFNYSFVVYSQKNNELLPRTVRCEESDVFSYQPMKSLLLSCYKCLLFAGSVTWFIVVIFILIIKTTFKKQVGCREWDNWSSWFLFPNIFTILEMVWYYFNKNTNWNVLIVKL